MRAIRLALAVPALCAVLALTACTGGNSDGNSPAAPGKSAGESPTVQGHTNGTCKVAVAVTQDVVAKWQGAGEVRVTADGLAVYSAEKDGVRLSVYSEEGDIPASVNLGSGDDAFATPVGDATGLDVAVDGKSATVDADLLGNGSDAMTHVTATFKCRL